MKNFEDGYIIRRHMCLYVSVGSSHPNSHYLNRSRIWFARIVSNACMESSMRFVRRIWQEQQQNSHQFAHFGSCESRSNNGCSLLTFTCWCSTSHGVQRLLHCSRNQVTCCVHSVNAGGRSITEDEVASLGCNWFTCHATQNSFVFCFAAPFP